MSPCHQTPASYNILVSFFTNLRRSIIEFFEAFLISALTILLVFWLVGQPLEVTGNSMVPTFQDHEQILAEKLSYRFNSPMRGDVVILRLPENKNVYAIKRIVGMPGEEVELVDGLVFINGKQLLEPYLENNTQTWGNNFLKDGIATVIPENSYLLLGDNRSVSLDSRAWGFISKEDILGKPVLVYAPISNFRLL